MKTLLVMTVGQTDVQVVDQGTKRPFDKDQVGAIHDQLRDNLASWTLVESPAESGKTLTSLPLGVRWEICTPKLDAAVAYIGETSLNSILVLETTRNNQSDPRFAGKVLQMRAMGKGINDVRCCAYLGPEDRNLEERDCPLDAIIRRDVVRRIEDAIREALKDATRVVVATTGGMPEIKTLVKELVRLHAPPHIEPDEIEVDDGARNGQPDRAVSRKRIDPIEPIRLRKQALSLIGKGDLLGAWGAVSHLKNEPGQGWTQVIESLSQFASSMPFEPPLPSDRDLMVLNHKRMAVRAALRVELALRAGDIPRAVHGTVAFFEAALWDKLGERIERSSDPKKRRLFKVKSGAVPAGDKLLRKGDGSEEDRKCPFELKEMEGEVAWFWVYDGDGGPAARLAKYFLKCDAITTFDKTLGSTIRELRNDVAHNEPTSDLMKEARTRMQAAQLWSKTETVMFLSQPLVQNVLKELGEPYPAQLCDDLLSAVRKRLRTIG